MQFFLLTSFFFCINTGSLAETPAFPCRPSVQIHLDFFQADPSIPRNWVFFFLVRTLVYTVYVHKTPSFKKRSIYEVNLPFSCLINLCSYFNFRVESVSWSRNYEMIASGHSPLNYVINTWWIYPGINH